MKKTEEFKPMKLGSKITFRTCGRGVARTWKGTIQALVQVGEIAPKKLWDLLPHPKRISNRPRYVVKLAKGDALVWANATGPNIVAAGATLPKHEPRIAAKAKKAKTKKAVKAKKAAPKPKAKKTAKAKKPSKKDIVDNLSVLPTAEPKAEKKRSGGDKPKTTWYGLKDGKIVSVRKVVCPEGFSKDKPAVDAADVSGDATESTPAPATPAAEAPTALPQASLG